MTERWDPHIKPPADICPQEFCWFWAWKGDRVDLSENKSDSFEAATKAAFTVMKKDGCACTFGICTRVFPTKGDRDFYEPCEPRHAKAGLPWFYFISGIEKLGKEFQEEYLRESTLFWGSNNSK